MNARPLPFLALALLLGGCASVPDPPTVSGRSRSAINHPADQRMLAAMMFPPAPAVSGAVVLTRDNPPVSYTLTGCYTRSAQFQPALDHAAKVRALLQAGVTRVEVRAMSGRDPITPQRRTLRCMESAWRWLQAEGVPPGRIFLNYSPVTAGGETYAGQPMGRRVDIEFFRSSINQ